MPGRVTDEPDPEAVDLTLAGGGWRRLGVTAVFSVRLRRRGLRPRAEGRAVLMRGSSVHGFGMREPLSVVAIDREGRVVDTAVLRTGRLLRFAKASWVLELPAAEPLPPCGMRLEVRTRS